MISGLLRTNLELKKQMHVYSERVFEIVNMGDMEHRKYLPMIPSEMLNYKVIIPLSVTFQARDSQTTIQSTRRKVFPGREPFEMHDQELPTARNFQRPEIKWAYNLWETY